MLGEHLFGKDIYFTDGSRAFLSYKDLQFHPVDTKESSIFHHSYKADMYLKKYKIVNRPFIAVIVTSVSRI